MKKNFLIGIFTIFISILFCSKVDALECLYETEDGKERVALTQFYVVQIGFFDLQKTNYQAYATVLDDFNIENDSYSFSLERGKQFLKVENSDEFNNTWKKIDSCPLYLNIKMTSEKGIGEVYVSDEYKKDESALAQKLLYLKEGYKDQTPNKVKLNKMRCVYANAKETSHWIDQATTNENSSNGYMYKSTFAFEISLEKNNVSYSLWNNNQKLYDNDISSTGINQLKTSYRNRTYYDNFTMRSFWDKNQGYYWCPEKITVMSDVDLSFFSGENANIYISYEEVTPSKDKTFFENIAKNAQSLFGTSSEIRYDVYELDETSSYIDYSSNNIESNICNYTYEDKVCDKTTDPKCNPETYITLNEISYENGEKEILWGPNTNYISGNLISSVFNYNESLYKGKTCEEMPPIYIKLTNVNGIPSWFIYSEPVEGAEKLVTDVWTNTQDASSVIESYKFSNGVEFKNLTCDLSGHLKNHTDIATLNKTTSLVYYDASGENKNEYNISSIPCSSWGISSDYDCSTENCKEYLEYTIQKQIRDTYNYCNTVYKKYLNNTAINSNKGRYDECKSFETFYDSLVDNGIIGDIFAGCDVFSGDMKVKLNNILNVIKIAGPILAVLLGMVDFVKVLAAGDADKEMKTAWKRFRIRLFSAALLFLVPILLSILINMFIGDKIDNPYCGLLETNESE